SMKRSAFYDPIRHLHGDTQEAVIEDLGLLDANINNKGRPLGRPFLCTISSRHQRLTLKVTL
ncbi:hypothetical protein, partial [Halodesulfovibrio sp.]|uniref:hypothetical protein n=1 Tax=Halodesulfovibrio sp. TaxID=1912772 RepID=UPI0025C6F49D